MSKSIVIRDMQEEDGLFASTCGHMHETEADVFCHERRLPWIRKQYSEGFRTKVALSDDKHAGLLFLSPIEAVPELQGTQTCVIKCVAVTEDFRHLGIGRSLVAEAESEAMRNRYTGIATVAFYHDFWFMPAPFFERCGYTQAEKNGRTAIMWKPFDKTAVAPSFCRTRYEFVPVPGKIAVDLFWSDSCRTTCIEAENVRQVVAELGDSVILRDHCVDDPVVRAKHPVGRGIFINGKSVSWGHEAAKDALLTVLREAQQDDGQLSSESALADEVSS
jgi:GNAT superfamily N-acetyltransferase